MKKKASITVFLSLLIAVSLMFLGLLLQSVEMQNARVNMEAGAEEGLYSLFADYNRELFDRYHVFFVEGGYGTGKMQPGRMYKTIEDGLKGSGRSENDQDIHWGKKQNINIESGEITGYLLASDHMGDAFYTQAVTYMEETAGIQGVQTLIEKNESRKREMEQLESEPTDEIVKEAEKQYGESQREQEQQKEQEQPEESSLSEVEVPENFENPLETVKEMRKQGILGFVIPGEREISNKEVEKSSLCSHRQLETGMGVIERYGKEDRFYGKPLFEEYLVRHFNCYGKERGSDSLEYQLEYIVAGKTEDLKNLKGVVYRLLAVRQGANMIYLLKDQESREQIRMVSVLLCAVLKMPSLEGIVQTLLTAAWAYMESIYDVRELMEGGKVPLMKEKGEWKLALSSEGHFCENGNRGSGENGLAYEEYLRILLMTVAKEDQIMRAMDLVEQVMRTGGKQNNFRMDLCVCQVQTEMELSCRGRRFSMKRGYRYDR